MSIKVLHPGLLTTVQDIGRYGSQKYGVIVSGAMDSYSLRLSNILVGNKENEAALEITIYGTTLQLEEDTLIAITGGDFLATIDGKIVPLWRPVLVKKNAILKFHSAIKGSRAYIAFAGGIDIPQMMGSKSTYIRANIGGFEGRALQKGDKLNIGVKSTLSEALLKQLDDKNVPWSVNFNELINFRQEPIIRVLKGTEFDRFDKESRQTFFQQPYTLTVQSDRMGYRIEGPPLSLSEKFELLSEGVTFGTIQIPPSGQPIILMADRQTTGGYPKFGQVITADLPSLAQLQPGMTIRFKEVTLKEAETALLQNEQFINNVKTAIQYKLFH
ncbi:biotin-dependent carboxyltransferase family protein [Psychrobacillus lasiicapitis]|uniref:Biotin-dependent carboxyltransferase n=1 Tax=Psychrobacillus lasiicapitis TaxID=1636719 RepID=A0A544THF3_9BACI|nr:biotin-dependent carboxyltransferase family protein [Psychrobacillus lasiicapitis]TQR16887.1 biotin-dependent carboxyltransferase [Psychrobacillus lasiicapitis]GGA26339.1 KipI antagonist [Psychrobacillus lasiicapitis]